jgi:hypothetical protein
MAMMQKNPLISSAFEDTAPAGQDLNEEEARRLAEAYSAGDAEAINTILSGGNNQTPVEPFRSFTDNTPTGFSQVGAPAIESANVTTLSNVTSGKNAVLEDVAKEDNQANVSPLNAVPTQTSAPQTTQVSEQPLATDPTAGLTVDNVLDWTIKNPNATITPEIQALIDGYFVKNPIDMTDMFKDMEWSWDRGFYNPKKEAEEAAKKDVAITALSKQILNQGTASQWTGQGYGSAEANAKDMAKILTGIGITDIKQFGKVEKTVPVSSIGITKQNGVWGQTSTDEDGNTSFNPVDESKIVKKNGEDVYKTGETYFGNKETGQAVPNTYSERQTGNAWGGTFAGKGNTGYRVQFTDDGTPVFYTTGASSNDLVNFFADNPILGKIATVAAAYYGGPAGVAALQAAQGASIEDIAKSALLTYAGGQIAQGVSGSESLVNSVGQNTANIIGKTAGQVVSSGGKADIIATLVGNGVEAGTNSVLGNIEGFGDLSAGQKTFVQNVVKTTLMNGGHLTEDQLVDAALAAGTTAIEESKKGVNAVAIKAQETVDNAVNNAVNNGDVSAPSNLATKEIKSSITEPTTTDTITAGNIDTTLPTVDPLEEIKGMSKFNDAYAAARKLLGPNQTFEWNGKQYSTATAEERPELSGKTTTPAISSTITNYVTDKLAKNITSPEFNPADLTKDEMAKFVSAYSSATDAQKAQLLKGADQATYKVIDTLLKQTAALNPTGAGDLAAPSTSPDLKAWDKSAISTAVDVAKTAGNLVAADVAGLGVRGAQFLGDLMGQDTDGFAKVQNLLVNDKDKSMSKLVGNEKVVAGGIASGIESAVAWTLGGPMAGVATVAGVVANNTWVEGANEGLSAVDNAKRTAAMTALEVAGEMLGIPGMKNIMKGVPITGSVSDIVNAIKRSGAGMLNEQASELMTTIAQFSVDKFASFGLSKDATFDDFQKALKDTIIATAAAVGTSSGISTATRSASGSTSQIADADRTAVSPDLSLLTKGSEFGAKAGDTSNQGLNPVSSEAIDFNKLDKSGQTSILDNLRNQIATLGLATTLTLGSVGAIASPVDIDSHVTTSIQSAVDSKSDITKAINSSVSSSISSAINNKVDSSTAIDSAISSAITSAVNNNTSPTTAIDSSVSSAINSAVSSNVNVSAAVTSAVNSAVTTAINTSVANNTMTTATVNSAVNSAINSAVTTAVNNNVNVNTAVNNAVTAAVTAAVTNNVSVADAINAAVSSVTNLNVDVKTVTALATQVANDTVVKKKVIDEINTLISVPPVTPPVTPPVPPTVTPTKTVKQKQKVDEALAGSGFTFGGTNVIDPLKESFLKTYMTKDSFKDPLEKLREMQGADQPADNQMMQQQIDPYLASILAERNATQPETQEPQSPPLWSFGQEPDSIDAMLTPKTTTASTPETKFKSGGFVAPLQMASGGGSGDSMALPLLAKSGGALGALPRPDGRMDFRHGAHVAGDGDGQSDDIKAMLADGEFVFPADVVSALGNGSTKAGSDKLYEMMHAIRDRARSTGTKDLPPPALKSPLDYLKKGSKK